MSSCIICSRDSSSNFQNNDKNINSFVLHRIFKLPSLDDEKSTSSFCGRCSSLLSQVYDLYNNKSEIDLELTGIRYKLLDNLVNDEGIQSNEDLNELKQLHLERFILFHKVRTALNLDPREPQLSPHDKLEKYHESQNCIICGDQDDSPSSAERKRNNTTKIVLALESVYPFLYDEISQLCKNKASSVSFCGSCSYEIIIHGKSCIVEISTFEEEMEKIKFQLLDRLLNHQIKSVRRSSSSTDAIKRCLLVEKAKTALKFTPPDQEQQLPEINFDNHDDGLPFEEISNEQSKDKDSDSILPVLTKTNVLPTGLFSNYFKIMEPTILAFPNHMRNPESSLLSVNLARTMEIDYRLPYDIWSSSRFAQNHDGTRDNTSTIDDGNREQSADQNPGPTEDEEFNDDDDEISDGSTIEIVKQEIQTQTGHVFYSTSYASDVESESSVEFIQYFPPINNLYIGQIENPGSNQEILSILTNENVVLFGRHEDEIHSKENEATLASPGPEDCGPKHKVQLNAINNDVQKSTNTSSIVENENGTNTDYFTIEMEMEEMFNSKPDSDSHDQDNNCQQNQNETNQNPGKSANLISSRSNRKDGKIERNKHNVVFFAKRAEQNEDQQLDTDSSLQYSSSEYSSSSDESNYDPTSSSDSDSDYGTEAKTQNTKRKSSSLTKIPRKRMRKSAKTPYNYSCLLCDKWMGSTTGLRYHYYESHNNPSIWPCSVPGCNESYTKRRLLYRHRKLFHKNLSSPTSHETRRSTRIATSTSNCIPFNYQCLLCNEKMKNAKEVSDHYKSGIHGPYPINCWPCNFPGCLKSFSTRRALYQHRHSTHENLPVNLENLPAQENNEEAFVTTTNAIEINCIVCQEDVQNISAHYKEQHPDLQTNVRCFVCKQYFANFNELFAHQEIIHGLAPKWNNERYAQSQKKKEILLKKEGNEDIE